MESVIIEEMRAFMRLDLNPRQKQYFADTIAVAKRVDIVRAADVFNDYDYPGYTETPTATMLSECAFALPIVPGTGAILRGQNICFYFHRTRI